VYETKEVVYNSSWEILESVEAIFCQAALYCKIYISKNNYIRISNQRVKTSQY